MPHIFLEDAALIIQKFVMMLMKEGCQQGTKTNELQITCSTY